MAFIYRRNSPEIKEIKIKLQLLVQEKNFTWEQADRGTDLLSCACDLSLLKWSKI